MSSKYLKQPSHPGYKSAISFNCDYCGLGCFESISSYNKKKRHFCSRKCYSLFRENMLPKEEQHAYKGGGFQAEEKNKRKIARSILNHAIRDGRVSRMPCEKCGNPTTQGHHEDYSLPLEVRWLCHLHHQQAHGRLIHENTELLK